MIQFYFLSVLLNVLVGFYLFFDGKISFLEQVSSAVNIETAKLVIGIFSALTGLVKILSPIEGDIPIIGDLLPASANLICGFILVFEFYRQRSTITDSEDTNKIEKFLLPNKKIIGGIAIIVAALHFLLPRVLFI